MFSSVFLAQGEGFDQIFLTQGEACFSSKNFSLEVKVFDLFVAFAASVPCSEENLELPLDSLLRFPSSHSFSATLSFRHCSFQAHIPAFDCTLVYQAVCTGCCCWDSHFVSLLFRSRCFPDDDEEEEEEGNALEQFSSTSLIRSTMALFRSGRMVSVAGNVKMKVAAGLLLLLGLWFAVAQYNSTCPVWRTEPSSSRSVVPGGVFQGVVAAGSQTVAGAEGHNNANEHANSFELSNLLKEAMQYGQVGKPTIHLVEVMEPMNRSFFMFVCSNCFCDICDKVRLLGYWSPVESQIFHHVLRKHGCNNGKALVIDVGAHVGWFSLLSASYGCRVVSFEPNSVALRYLNLSKSINNFPQVGLHPKGVGQADSQAEYKQTDTWALNGFVTKRRRRSLLETVDVARLDSVVDEDVLLLKIDTEGYEANVFAGAQKLLSQQKIQHILVEVKSASTPGKRSLLYSIFKTGGFARVYNWDEVVTPLSVPFEQFGLQNATIVDVTEIVSNPESYAPLQFQDFWFCKEPQLPWL